MLTHILPKIGPYDRSLRRYGSAPRSLRAAIFGVLIRVRRETSRSLMLPRSERQNLDFERQKITVIRQIALIFCLSMGYQVSRE